MFLFNINDVKDFVLRWGPRAIVSGFAGYYSLGYAYETGLMASIDKVAISILKQTGGYAGIGAAMPHFQWYAAMGVRLTAAGAAALAYDIVARHLCCCCELDEYEPEENPA